VPGSNEARVVRGSPLLWIDGRRKRVLDAFEYRCWQRTQFGTIARQQRQEREPAGGHPKPSMARTWRSRPWLVWRGSVPLAGQPRPSPSALPVLAEGVPPFSRGALQRAERRALGLHHPDDPARRRDARRLPAVAPVPDHHVLRSRRPRCHGASGRSGRLRQKRMSDRLQVSRRRRASRWRFGVVDRRERVHG